MAGFVLLALGVATAYIGLSIEADVAFRLAVLAFAAAAFTAAALNILPSSGGALLGRVVAILAVLLGVVALAIGALGSGAPDWGDLIAAIFLPAGALLVAAGVLVLVLLRRASRPARP